MPGNGDRKNRLRDISHRAAAETDQELSAALAALRRVSIAELEALKPRMSDPETFAKLVDAVRRSTDLNESQAGLRKRLEALGKGVLGVAKEAAKLIKP